MQKTLTKNRYFTAFVALMASFVFAVLPSVAKADDGWFYTPDYSYYGNDYTYTPDYSYYNNSYSYTPDYSYYGNDYTYTPDYSYYGSNYSYTPDYSYYNNSYSYTPDYSYYGNDYTYTPDYSYYGNDYTYTPDYSYYGSNYTYTPTYDTYTYTPNYEAYSYVPSYDYYTYTPNYNTGYTYVPPTNYVGYNYNYNYSNNNNPDGNNYSELTANCPTSGTYNLNQSVNWTVTASGGAGNYKYSWSGDVSGSGSSISKSYSTVGTKTATVQITSGNKVITRSCSVNIQDNTPELSGSCPTNGTYNINQTVNWVANASGGTGNYTYSWSGDVSGSGSSVSKTYSSTGTKNATVTITSGNKSITRSCNVNIQDNSTSDLSGYCSVSGSYETDKRVTWRAYASGGTGNYTYRWSGDVSGNDQSVEKRYSSRGTKSATVTITSGSQSITRSCEVYIYDNYNNNNDDLTGSCRVSPSNPRVGDSVTFTAEADGGDGDYSYRWSGDVSGSRRSVSKTFNSSGTYEARVRITDGNGDSVTKTCTVDVGRSNNSSNGNVTLVTTNTPGSGTLASGVFLSQIPYTGIAENFKMVLFVIGMTLWSAFMAWIFLKKRAEKKGLTQREMIERFKQDNLAKRLTK